MRIFPTILDQIIAKVRAEYDVNNKKPYYLYGQYRSIANELIEKSKNVTLRGEKYPLVLLGLDADYLETVIDKYRFQVSFNLWILSETKEEWFTSDRFTNVYETELFPIYQMVEEKIFQSTHVSSLISEVQPRIRLFPFWGSEAGQILNDPIDAIMIQFQNLVINVKC